MKSLIQAVNPQDDWGLVFVIVITGMVVVFLILLILIVILELMGRGISGRSRAEKKDAVAVVINTPYGPTSIIRAESAEAVKSQFGNNAAGSEIIAAITAAIEMYGESEGKRYVITGIRKKSERGRSVWGGAGVAEAMTNFTKGYLN